MPFLLPAGDAFTDDYQCALVFYPNMVEHRRAMFGQLAELGHWFNWERDDAKRGKDAAAAWREANLLTLECMELMNCQDILDALGRLELMMETCCASIESPYIDPLPDEELWTNTGSDASPPSTWGGSSLDLVTYTWEEYKCEAAHAVIDAWQLAMARLAALSGVGVTLYADSVAIAVGVLVPGAPWYVEVSVEVIGRILQAFGGGFLGFQDAIDAVEAHRDIIACRMVEADGSHAVGEAMRDEIAFAVQGVTLANLITPYMPYAMYGDVVYDGCVEDVNGVTRCLPALAAPGTHTCNCCPVVTILAGILVAETPTSVTVRTTRTGDVNRAAVRFNWDGSAFCGGLKTITGASATQPQAHVYLMDQTHTITYQSGPGTCGSRIGSVVGRSCATVYAARSDVYCDPDNLDFEFTVTWS